MKIIDLLNKIANYDEPIIKIKYQDIEYKFDGNTYRDDDGEGMSITAMIDSDLSNLNDEVEIIEEEKKIPEKLNNFTISVGNVDESDIEEYIQKLFNQQYEIFKKINSIIDYLKSKGE